ncbi:Ldh family oxidoreductase [Loktanella salsilacus]|uniref:Ldh family oxidoreductase n=1 Tax=Loktanella salsilacus TaxID=195913 RepID=UPI0020B82125|nr:Ldh family oxidoreductase [Loktanella salsilacus]UTH46342.1 Ldh family oxidoreductase [Loktanella salsilacus]
MTQVDAEPLRVFVAQLLSNAGLDTNFARTVAEILVEGDLMGHKTHGVALVPSYLAEIAAGRTTLSGEPDQQIGGASAQSWDGRWLPGPVLVSKALTVASDMAKETGIGCIAISRSQHIACLAAYLLPVAEAGFAAIITSSSPTTRSVAPFGATEGIYSPNPIAAGWPTSGEPVIFDISTSITTNRLVSEKKENAARMPGLWLSDAQGRQTDDPAVIGQGGALLPIGGTDHGHKGFALGLLVEMLTSGLAGFGRADTPDRWGAVVNVLVFNPSKFSGAAAFSRQTESFRAACTAATVADGSPPVRIPGQNALRRRNEQIQSGVTLPPALVSQLKTLDPRTPFPETREPVTPAGPGTPTPKRIFL